MGSPGKSKKPLKPLVLDLNQVIPFLRGVSYVIVAQRTTRLEWRADDTPVRYLYKAFFGIFGEPGTAAVTSAPEAEIMRRVDLETHHRIDVLMARAEAGPAAVAKYLSDLEEIRVSALKSLREVYADANQINRDISRELGRTIEFLWDVKLGSKMVVKTVGVFSGAVGLVALAADVFGDPIEKWAEAGSASGIVMVATDQAKKGLVEETASRTAEKIVDKVNGKATAAELEHAVKNMKRIEGKLTEQITRLGQNEKLAQLGIRSPRIDQSTKDLTRLAERNAGKLDTAQKTVAKSTGKLLLAKAVSIVFLVKDAKELFAQRNAAVEAARR